MTDRELRNIYFDKYKVPSVNQPSAFNHFKDGFQAATELKQKEIEQLKARLFEMQNAAMDINAKLAMCVNLFKWNPIETAPRNNARPLLLARFNDDGSMQTFDTNGSWESECESWEMPARYYFWASDHGYVEEPSHWMYQPDFLSSLTSATEQDVQKWRREVEAKAIEEFVSRSPYALIEE